MQHTFLKPPIHMSMEKVCDVLLFTGPLDANRTLWESLMLASFGLRQNDYTSSAELISFPALALILEPSPSTDNLVQVRLATSPRPPAVPLCIRHDERCEDLLASLTQIGSVTSSELVF